MRTAADEQPARLQPVELLELGGVAGDVAVLARDHSDRRVDEVAGDLDALVRERELVRLREERVAGEQGDAFSERDVRARTAAPLVVVVQRRKVVVDEREGVDELERGSRGESILDRGSVRLRHGEAEHWSDALAARFQGVAERLLEAPELRAERERAEVRVDGVTQPVSRLHRPDFAPASARPRSAARARRARR